MSTGQTNHQATQSLQGESSEPRTLDRHVRHVINLSLSEFSTAKMLTEAGEASKEKRRDLKRILEMEERKKAKEEATAAEGAKKTT